MRFHRFHLKFAAAALSSLCLSSAAASSPRRLDLAGVMELAGRRQADAIVAEERVQQAIHRLTQGRSAFFPQLEGTASFTRQTRNLEAMGIQIPGRDPIVGPFNTFDARARLTQTLFDAASIQRYRAFQAGRTVSEAESVKARLDAMILGATLFLEARRAAETVDLARSLLRRAENRLSVARENQESGAGSAVDVLRRESEVSDARQALEASLARALEARLDLQAALGLPQDEEVTYASTDPLGGTDVPNDEEIAAAAKSHPVVMVAEKTILKRRRERSVEKADFFPRLDAAADYGASGTSPSNAAGTYSFGGQMTIPIFRGGLRAGRIREADSRIREGEARRDEAIRKTEAAARSARAGLVQASALTTAARNEAAEARERLRLAKDRLDSGLGSSLEVVEAETSVAAAQDRLREAQAARTLARLNLEYSLGRLERSQNAKEIP